MTAIDLPLPPPAAARLVLRDTDAPAVESPRPVLHPILDALGRPVTDYRPADHTWHQGLSIALPVVRADDGAIVSFWGGPTFVSGVGYRQLDNVGEQEVDACAAADDGAELSIRWRDAAGRTLFAERRSYRVRPLDDRAWAVDVASTWTAAVDLRFGSPGTEGRVGGGYGGFALRAHPRFTDADVVLDGRVTAEEDARGATARWCALRAPGEGAVLLASREPHADVWFVRSAETPLLCVAPFFHEELPLPRGQERSWAWRFVSVADDRSSAELDELAS